MAYVRHWTTVIDTPEGGWFIRCDGCTWTATTEGGTRHQAVKVAKEHQARAAYQEQQSRGQFGGFEAVAR